MFDFNGFDSRRLNFLIMSYRGPYSEVYRCAKRDTGQNYAVKIVDVAQYTSSPNLSIEGTSDECPAFKSTLINEILQFFSLFV